MSLLKIFLITFMVSDLTLSRKLPDDVLKIWHELVDPYTDDCIQKTNPDLKDLDAIINRGFVPLNPTTNCFVNCIYQRTEFLKPNGEVHMENLMGLLSYMTPELTQMCSDEAEWYSGNDICEKAYILGNCVTHALSV